MIQVLLRQHISWIGIFAAVLCLDQVTKIAARIYLIEYEVINIIGDYFVLVLAQNTGAFLSIGSELSEPFHTLLLLGIPAILLIWGIAYLLRNPKLPNSSKYTLALILSGGIGNIIDRFAAGSVTDFLFINLGGWLKTGIFNVADMAIMFGLGFYILQAFSSPKKSP